MANDDLCQASHKKLCRLMQEEVEKTRLKGLLESQEKELRKIRRDLRHLHHDGEDEKGLLESNALDFQWWINLTRKRIGDCQAAIDMLKQEIKAKSYLWVGTFEERAYAQEMLADGGGHVSLLGPREVVAGARRPSRQTLPSSRSFMDAEGPSGQYRGDDDDDE